MKKIIGILLFLVAFAFSADVKPFYFDGIPESSQHTTWDELMKYKLWGTEYFSVGNGVIIPDESGRNGTNGNLKGTGSETLLGGPIIVTGDINVGNGYTFPSGPTVANSFTMGNLNNGYFGGTVCLADTNVSQQFKQGLTKGGGELTNDCSTLPKAVGLSIPSVVWPDSELHAINIPMHGTGYIDIPAGEGSYDIYLSGITMDQESKLYIRMPDEGRLTRIFVNGKISLSNHAVIQTMNGSTIVSNDDYGGNLMFYTSEDLTFSNTDYCIRQGTYISAKTFRMVSNVTFAGQLLGNELIIGDNIDGKNFLYVPFDPPIINLGDPKTNALGNFVENDKDVEVPIFLDTLAPGKVSFNYCFILNENATIDDFNIENYPIKECGKDSGVVIINEGNSVPTIPVKINVKDDGKIEGTEVVGLKIYNVSGAALPGNKKTHIFTLTLSDGDLFKISTDGLAKDVPENKKDTVLGQVKVLGGNEFVRFETTNPKYTIDSITGIITLNTAYDYEVTNKDTIKIIAKDISKVDTVDYVINVLDVNENPIIENQNFSIPENNGTIISVGTIKTSDIDTSKAFTNNKITLADTTNFIVVGDKVYPKKSFDYESGDTVYTIKAYVTDVNDSKLRDSATITIKITNVNEKPKLDSAQIAVDENYTGIVDTITAKDPDNDKLTYKVIDKGWSITNEGVLSITTPLDYEKQKTTSVTVIVSDGDKSDTLKYNVKINNINEPVHVKDTTFAINENLKGTLGKVTAWDEDNDIINYIISDTVSYSISDGKIILKNPFDYETKKSDTITVWVSDGKLKDSAKVIININNVNEPLHIDSVKTSIDENSPKSTILDTIHGYDEDGEKITYTPIGSDITIKDSIIYLNRDVDYEQDSIITVKVIASTKDDKDTISVVIKVNNVNEPVHVKDTTFVVPENTTGPIGKVEAWDEDNDKISYRVSDSTKYSIDDNGVISVKVPFDFETQKNDSLIVYAKDPSGMTDSAVIHINVKDEPESSNVQIIHVDTRDSVYTETDKPIYTNDKDIEIYYMTDGKLKDPTITGLKEGENKIEICDVGVGKDTKGCDTVTVWYSSKTPIITVATIDKNKPNMNNITIIDEPDGNQYVNNKNPEIKVTVKDPTNAKKDTTFNINVDLKTVDVPVKSLTNKTIEPIDIALTPDAKHEVIGKDSVKVIYYDPIAKATVSYVTNSEGKRINDEFTVSYVEKVNGQDVTISYTTDSYIEVKSNYSISYSVPQGKDTITVSYQVDSEGKIQKINGNVGYTISYSYTNKYGNTGTSEIQVVLDDVPPKVEIYKLIAGKDTLYPGEGKNWTEYVKSSSIIVFWTVDGKDQDTLTLQGLKAEKINPIVRCYQDKANNQTCDTVNVYVKGAKEIEIKIAHPVTEIDKDRVDSFYNEGGKYNPKNPIQIIAQDASEDKLPEPVGVGIKIGLALPILNQNGGMPTTDDIVQTIDGVTGIVIDGNGNVVTDAIAEIRDNSTKIISVDNYIENYCTDQYKEEVRKNGIEKVPFYDMKYSMHVWIFNNNAEYVNDFNFEYTIDENQKVDASGMLNLMVDWLAAKDGYVKAKNNKAIGTGAYIGKISAVSVAKAKCTLNSDTKKGTKIKKDETEMFTFGYKRPISK